MILIVQATLLQLSNHVLSQSCIWSDILKNANATAAGIWLEKMMISIPGNQYRHTFLKVPKQAGSYRNVVVIPKPHCSKWRTCSNDDGLPCTGRCQCWGMSCL